MTISVVVPTYNCATNLQKCLDSVRWADEILVVDMGSTDKTTAVARKYNAKIYKRFPVTGNFDENRQYGMFKATGDWILKLDSDEILSPTLQNEIKDLLKSNTRYNGFNLYNRIFMLGFQVRHGLVKAGSRELRLVRNGYWHYKPFRFHQLITVDGKVGFLRNYYDHFNVSTISEFINKMNLYTSVDARHYTVKISMFSILIAPVKTFCKLYIWQLGFLDGGIGLIVCLLFALYNLTEKVKVWEFKYL